MTIGLVPLLTVLFVALKLTGAITWSWLWVLSPVWISLGLGALLWAIFAVVAVIVANR